MNNAAVIAWLLDAGTWIGVALLGGCLAYGLALIAFPGPALQFSANLSRRYSGRRALRPLEVPRATERYFYRHHKIVGSLLLAGVLAFFIVYFLDFPRDSALARLAGLMGRPLAGVVLDSVVAFFLVLNAAIAAISIVMIWRPSLLKPVEALANRWISTRQAFRGVDESHAPLDKLVRSFPRVAGLLVLLGAGYIVVGILVAMT